MGKLTTSIETPKGKVVTYKTKNGDIKAKITWNNSYFQKFNTNLERVSAYQDERFANSLMAYVSFKTGVQQKSIPISSVYGSGEIKINVPYARYQAYSPKIKNTLKGKRGKFPWERMVADKKAIILKECAEYSRRLNNG